MKTVSRIDTVRSTRNVLSHSQVATVREITHKARPVGEMFDTSIRSKAHETYSHVSEESSRRTGAIAHEIYSLSGTAEAPIDPIRNARVNGYRIGVIISGLLQEQTKRGVWLVSVPAILSSS